MKQSLDALHTRLISSKESLAKEARAGLARFSKEETFYA